MNEVKHAKVTMTIMPSTYVTLIGNEKARNSEYLRTSFYMMLFIAPIEELIYCSENCTSIIAGLGSHETRKQSKSGKIPNGSAFGSILSAIKSRWHDEEP